MAMARTIPETVALHPLSNVGHSKKDITQTLTLTQYHFIIHSRSTTHYLQICCPISTTTTPQGVIPSFSCKPNENPPPLSERGQGSDCDKRRIPFPSHEDEADPRGRIEFQCVHKSGTEIKICRKGEYTHTRYPPRNTIGCPQPPCKTHLAKTLPSF